MVSSGVAVIGAVKELVVKVLKIRLFIMDPSLQPMLKSVAQ
jgi:hypothetical protein